MTLPTRLRKLAQNEELVQRFVLRLPIGRSRALKAESFCKVLDIPYEAGTGAKTKQNGAARLLRDLALIAVSRGICVAGDNSGYYIPANRGELDATLKRQEASARTKLDRIADLRRSAERMFPGVATA